jgi:hypothetical protein
MVMYVIAGDLWKRVERSAVSRASARVPRPWRLSVAKRRSKGAELDEMLAEGKAWVDQIGIEYVTVFAGGKTYTVEHTPPWPPPDLIT